ncbi:AraC family transcriptional regulator [Massilia sp. CF038]|uniref:helix-turn-helix domain-containing protein n=1 Tax=Massilia sp. CF038 TaxID=1881045 RepID=UPI000918509A|nr:AraC family transcriptional regulator [Massilia sp. CF038]SHH55135.1 transcriptional regulator, AraC family [Massilia sp. CF038]
MVLYQEYPPCPALAPYLACLWTCMVPAQTQVSTHRVLPDNCIDILWHDGDPHGSVAGMMSHAITVPFSRPARIIAVRFKPGAAAHFFPIPLDALTDLHPALNDLWEPGAAARFADALWSRPLTDLQALAAIEQLLLQRLREAAPRAGLVDAAVHAIERSHGAIRIEALATTLGVSRQHLASQFRARVGLPAKLFARVCRFQHASAAIRNTSAPDLAALALAAGYYDQPHMVHEFRALSGSAPLTFAPA